MLFKTTLALLLCLPIINNPSYATDDSFRDDPIVQSEKNKWQTMQEQKYRNFEKRKKSKLEKKESHKSGPTTSQFSSPTKRNTAERKKNKLND